MGGRERDGWMVALLVGRERDGWVVVETERDGWMVVERECDGWMVALLIGRERARRLDGC